MTTINVYLTFDGDCEEAFNFYKSVFGGEFNYSGKFSEMPKDPKYPVPEEDMDKIMHISLPISKETTLMGSDSSSSFGKTLTKGDNFSISINSDSVEEITRLFNELSAGGTVKMPLNKTFWGSYFGMFTDKYGINWMANCELEEHRNFENQSDILD